MEDKIAEELRRQVNEAEALNQEDVARQELRRAFFTLDYARDALTELKRLRPHQAEYASMLSAVELTRFQLLGMETRLKSIY